MAAIDPKGRTITRNTINQFFHPRNKKSEKKNQIVLAPNEICNFLLSLICYDVLSDEKLRQVRPLMVRRRVLRNILG